MCVFSGLNWVNARANTANGRKGIKMRTREGRGVAEGEGKAVYKQDKQLQIACS